MTASQHAKRMGLKSLTEVAEHTGASLQTLINWSKHKPKLFNVVCLGVGTKLINQETGLKDKNGTEIREGDPITSEAKTGE